MRCCFQLRLVVTLILIGCLPLGVFAGEDPAVRVLDNGVLIVRVMDPLHPERYNRGMRFTPLAAVLGVEKDGVEYLYCPEAPDPLNDHAGLAAEFDLCIPGGPETNLPAGYWQAREGEGFLKIGVGALRKGKKTYNFFQHPELLEAAETSVEWRSDAASFRQVFRGVRTPSYAYTLEAELVLDKNTVTVEWRLSNTGSNRITTRHYTHNFFRIGGQPVQTGYVLSFPYDFVAKGLESGQKQVGREIEFFAPIPRWINAVVPYPAGYAGTNQLTLRQTESGRSIVCETSLPGLRTDVHARADFIAPEQFIEITLNAGETQTWKRHYIFNSN